MKSIVVLLFFLFRNLLSYSQTKGEMEYRKIGVNDSIKLSNIWTTFFKALESNDIKEIKRNSLKEINCSLCIDKDNNDPSEDNIIPIDTFINHTSTIFIDSPLFRAIKKGRIHFAELMIPDYRTRNLPKSYGKDLVVFEIWIQTYLPNEWVEGHEGQSHGFQFVKINNNFKFYGLTSVP